LTILKDAELPASPHFHLNLRLAAGSVSAPADAFVRQMRAGFAARHR
jgi:hypothetical protein